MKNLFVICPIGEAGTSTRERSDQVLKFVIKPAAEACGYFAIRGDQSSNPAIITSDIIDCLVDSDIVVADLTDHNPNVYYELGIRHALGKPVIQIIHQGQPIPFDVRQIRTIEFDHQSVPGVHQTVKQMQEAIKSIEENPRSVQNPISIALEIKTLHDNNEPLRTSLNEVITLLQKNTLADEKYNSILLMLEQIQEFQSREPVINEQLIREQLIREQLVREQLTTEQIMSSEIYRQMERFYYDKEHIYREMYDRQINLLREIAFPPKKYKQEAKQASKADDLNLGLLPSHNSKLSEDDYIFGGDDFETPEEL